jgi:hypothetical protein
MGTGDIIYAVSGRRVMELGLNDGYMLCRAPPSLSNVCEEKTGIGGHVVYFVQLRMFHCSENWQTACKHFKEETVAHL